MPAQKISIRPAALTDVTDICTVLLRSIKEICAPSYDHDPLILGPWCANKTPENITQWLDNPTNYFYVAENGTQIQGVGLIDQQGTIRLCYVLPEVLHRGIGHQVIAQLETKAAELDLKQITLSSTINAVEFYQRHSYQTNGPAEKENNRVRSYPMIKFLK